MNVPPLQPHNESQPDEQTLSQYAEHTRKSLIARLENWEDQRTWDEFYRTYWRLIYSVALKAGLREDEAWDVVQETILSIAKQSRKNIYKPEQGSFKLWLWNMTRWRINDQFRKRKKDRLPLRLCRPSSCRSSSSAVYSAVYSRSPKHPALQSFTVRSSLSL